MADERNLLELGPLGDQRANLLRQAVAAAVHAVERLRGKGEVRR